MAITILATTVQIGTVRAITMANTTTTGTATVGSTIRREWFGTERMTAALRGMDREAAALLLLFVGVEQGPITVPGSTAITRTDQSREKYGKSNLNSNGLCELIQKRKHEEYEQATVSSLGRGLIYGILLTRWSWTKHCKSYLIS